MNARNPVYRRLLPLLLPLLFRSLKITISSRPESLSMPSEAALFMFWHGKMITGWLLARRLFADRPVNAVVSLSEDGALLSGTLADLGFSLIRGSSSKESAQVRDAIAGTLERGGVVAMTPDGPRGPHHSFKYGSLRLASETSSPLIFAVIRYEAAWRLKSWDRFEIPRPFSRVTVTLHHIEVPRFTCEEELRSYCRQLSDLFSHE